MVSLAILAGVAFVAAAECTVLAVQAVRARSWWRAKLLAVFHGVCAVLRSIRAATACLCVGRPSGEARLPCELDEAVHARASEFRQASMRNAITSLNCMCSAFILVFVYGELSDVERVMSTEQVVTIAACGAFFCIAQCVHSLKKSPWAMRALYFIFLVPALVFAFFATESPGVEAALTVQIACFILDAASVHAGTAIVGHGMVSLVSAVAFHMPGSHIMTSWTAIEVLAIGWLCGVCLAAGLETGMLTLIHTQIEAEGLQEKQSVCTKLLRTFYDVILELDPELRIVSGAPELGSFLQRGGVSTARSVTTLEEVLPSEEHRQLIRERLCAEPREEEEKTDVLHLAMGVSKGEGDGEGDCQEVELFSMGFAGLGSRRRHLVGIRELEGDSPPAAPETDAEPAEVLVDFLSDKLQILECSETFRRKIGSIQDGMSLAMLLERGTKGEFARWMQDVCNLELGDRSEEAQRINFREARFKRTGQERMCLRASCQIDLERSLQDDNLSRVHLLFWDWRLLRILQRPAVGVPGNRGRGGGNGQGTPRHIEGQHAVRLPMRL
mmetsp:Transcript_51967/g.161263  ORF Transcript_51967/g.161263 Transcript_51967/m.161263 type:complete len:556 (-) Transcript_51967:245-1912(-)